MYVNVFRIVLGTYEEAPYQGQLLLVAPSLVCRCSINIRFSFAETATISFGDSEPLHKYCVSFIKCFVIHCHI